VYHLNSEAMHKALLLILTLHIAAITQACDVCSCSSGGSYYGILPQFQKHFIGVRYTGSSSKANHIPSYIADEIYKPATKLSMHTVELWGRFYIAKRVQLFAFVPFVVFRENENSVISTSYGLGDATLMTNYAVVNTGDSLMKKVKHTLLLGGGVKFPTGKFRSIDDGDIVNPNMQTGTGSFDFIINGVYTMRYKKVGMNTETSYRINTANRDHYRFGNRFNLSAKAFLWLKTKSISFLPNAGISFENAQKNTRNNYEKYFTGGNALYATAGMETYFKHFNLGFSFQQPVAYNLAEGLIKPTQRFTANLTFMF
jgi:hypothetical protein